MHIMHIALQGCLRTGPITYGLTADTGGHIAYLLDLAEALADARPPISESAIRQTIVTRAFDDETLGEGYANRWERFSFGADLLRLTGATYAYIPKEDLWREHDTLAKDLILAIGSMAKPPDIIHAHCGDAGIIAKAVNAHFAIPYIFTGHSLAHQKADCAHSYNPSDLTRRIAIEEEALSGAERIIASSRDEAELQYRPYRNARPDRIVINPPGCKVDRFSEFPNAQKQARIVRSVRPFLSDPDKPPILALARPVKKKNLVGLIHAYASDPTLVERANLVIFAGVREQLANLNAEAAGVIREIFEAIDEHNLWGHVAIPKTHTAEDVPAIYHFASALKGVFANLAHHEPFGLTLLEAAAAGLPIIATDRGGPRDIVRNLKCGSIVAPDDYRACSVAFHHHLDSQQRSDPSARTSEDEIGDIYSWRRHADDYLKEIRGILRQPIPALAKTPGRTHLLVSDIDDTLVGCADSLKAFADWRINAQPFIFAVATGRSIQDAVWHLRQSNAPMPDLLITSVGSELFYSHDLDLRHLEACPDWSAYIDNGWDRERLRSTCMQLEGLTPQPEVEQRSHKLSFFAEDGFDDTEARKALSAAGFAVSLIRSHDRFVDILPAQASKCRALRYVARQFGIPMSNTIAAGDSGNDRDLLEMAGLGVAVGNCRPELGSLRGKPNVFFARRPYAGAILEALDRFAISS